MNFKLIKSIAVYSLVVCLILPNFVHCQNDLSSTDTTTEDAQSTQTITATTASDDTVKTQATDGKTSAEPATTTQEPRPEVTTTVEPETTSTAEPEVTTTAEPEVTTTAEPEVTTTAEPEATTTVEPETKSTAEPEATTTVEPETTSTAEPEVTTTAEPEATTTVEPETTTKAGPEVTTTVEPETTSTAEPEVTTTVEPETTKKAGPEVTTIVQPGTTSTAGPYTTNPSKIQTQPSTNAATETTTQTEETTDSNETAESNEEIGEEIAKKLFKNVAKLQKRFDPMSLTDYNLYIKAGFGLGLGPNVHYELKNCILSGTSKVKSQRIYPVSPPRSPIRQFRGFAQIEKLKLSCSGYVTVLAVSRSFNLKGEIKDVVMRVGLKNYRKSGNVVVDSLSLQTIKEINLDLKIDYVNISVTKKKFLDHFRNDLHAIIATLVSDVIAKDAREVAASMKVQ